MIKFNKGARRANDGDMKAVVGTVIQKLLLKNRVGQMGAIPRKKIVHSMQDRQPQMGRVSDGLWRHDH